MRHLMLFEKFSASIITKTISFLKEKKIDPTTFIDSVKTLLHLDVDIDKLEYTDKIVHSGDVKLKSAYLKGFLLSEGHLKDKNPCLHVYYPKEQCIKRLHKSLDELDITNTYDNIVKTIISFDDRPLNKRFETKGLTARKKELIDFCSIFKASLPNYVFQLDHESKCSLIAGIFDGGGTVTNSNKSYGYQLTNTSEQYLIDVLTLLKSIGVYGKISLNKESGLKEMPGGVYFCKRAWRLTISQKYSIILSKQVKFERLIDFSGRRVKYNIKFKYNKVVRIEKCVNVTDVYCCTLPSTHKILTATGIITGQCGEQPMGADSNCLLGAFVLPMYIFENQFDYKTFENTNDNGFSRIKR